MAINTKLKRNIGFISDRGAGKTTLIEAVTHPIEMRWKKYEVTTRNPPTPGWVAPPKENKTVVLPNPLYTPDDMPGINKDINLFEFPYRRSFRGEGFSLRVVDGAVLVLDSLTGVCPVLLKCARQLQHAQMPYLAFCNKLDLIGNYQRAATAIKELGRKPLHLQIPIYSGDQFRGVIDLIKRRAYFNGETDEEAHGEEIPREFAEEAEKHRRELMIVLFDSDGALRRTSSEREISEAELKAAVRRACIKLRLTPVLLGSALDKKGLRLLWEAMFDYLPDPTEFSNTAYDQSRAKTALTCDPNKLFVGQVFYWEDGLWGMIAYVRIYQGQLRRGDVIVNCSAGNKELKAKRLVKVLPNEMHDLTEAFAGDIVGILGADECSLGDIFTDGTVHYTMKVT